MKKKRLHQLKLELQTLYTKKNNKDQIKINNIESEIEEIEKNHQKGAMIRSRMKHIENEEKPTKIFYVVEKQNQKKKNITKPKRYKLPGRKENLKLSQ